MGFFKFILFCWVAQILTMNDCDFAFGIEDSSYYDYSDYENAKSNSAESRSIVTNGENGFSVSPNLRSRSKITKHELLKNLKDISSSNKTISGIFVSRDSHLNHTAIETINRITGVFPGVITTMIGISKAGPREWQACIDEVISNWNSGYLVHIVWLCWDHPVFPAHDYTRTFFRTDNGTRWNDLVEDGGELNKKWKKQLDIIAPYLQQLQTAGVVPICELFTYINTDFNWKGRPGSNGSLKMLQISQDYLTKLYGLHSFIWVWSLWGLDVSKNVADFYPGNDYVDAVSVNMGFRIELTMNAYTELLNIVGDKPISMEYLETVPTPQLLNRQPRWTWFTALYDAENDRFHSDYRRLNETFQNPIVINKDGNEQIFRISKSTLGSSSASTSLGNSYQNLKLLFCFALFFYYLYC